MICTSFKLKKNHLGPELSKAQEKLLFSLDYFLHLFPISAHFLAEKLEKMLKKNILILVTNFINRWQEANPCCQKKMKKADYQNLTLVLLYCDLRG